MKAIKHTLTERWYLWEDARTLAQSDPEVDLSGDGAAYKPSGDYLTKEDEAAPAEAAENQGAGEGEGEGQKPGTASAGGPATPADKVDPSTLPRTPGETPPQPTRQ